MVVDVLDLPDLIMDYVGVCSECGAMDDPVAVTQPCTACGGPCIPIADAVALAVVECVPRTEAQAGYLKLIVAMSLRRLELLI